MFNLLLVDSTAGEMAGGIGETTDNWTGDEMTDGWTGDRMIDRCTGDRMTDG